MVDKFDNGTTVEVVSFITDRLVWAFGSDGDGDWWSPSEPNEDYINQVGEVVGSHKVGQSMFYVVRFANGIELTFDSIDLVATDRSISSPDAQEFTGVTVEEKTLAEKLLISRMASIESCGIPRSTLNAIVMDCIETAILFNHFIEVGYDKSLIISESNK